MDDRIPVPRPACKTLGAQGDKVFIFAATLSKALEGGPSRLQLAALALQGDGLCGKKVVANLITAAGGHPRHRQQNVARRPYMRMLMLLMLPMRNDDADAADEE